MHIIAFLIALAAVFCFLATAYLGTRSDTPRWHLGWLGLGLLTIAWMVQVIILTGSKVTVD